MSFPNPALAEVHAALSIGHERKQCSPQDLLAERAALPYSKQLSF